MRLALPAVLLLVSTGCIGFGAYGGAEVMPSGKAGGRIQANVGMDGGMGRVTAVVAGSFSDSYGDVGLGGEACWRTYGWRTPIGCGRILAVEAGAFQGRPTLGLLSPEATIGWWHPTRPVPKPRGRSGLSPPAQSEALEVRLSLGLKVRPLRNFEGTTPYLALTLGPAAGASFW